MRCTGRADIQPRKGAWRYTSLPGSACRLAVRTHNEPIVGTRSRHVRTDGLNLRRNASSRSFVRLFVCLFACVFRSDRFLGLNRKRVRAIGKTRECGIVGFRRRSAVAVRCFAVQCFFCLVRQMALGAVRFFILDEADRLLDTGCGAATASPRRSAYV